MRRNSIATCNECKHYIVRNVIGNANNRRAMLGIKMLDYFKKEEALLVDDVQNDNISSDIIESDYGIFKSKKSPNKLYGREGLKHLILIRRNDI